MRSPVFKVLAVFIQITIELHYFSNGECYINCNPSLESNTVVYQSTSAENFVENDRKYSKYIINGSAAMKDEKLLFRQKKLFSFIVLHQ